MKFKELEELLKCEDNLDVTIVCDDGEIRSNKSVLSAKSEYFTTMFKSDTFKESNGKVEVPCKKKIMDKVIEYIYFLYGGKLNLSTLNPEEQLQLLDMFRMMMLEDASAILMDHFMRDVVCRIYSKEAVESLNKYVDILDLALTMKFDYISDGLANRLGFYLEKIMHTVIVDEVILPNSVEGRVSGSSNVLLAS